jgi:hypothetical protein
VNAGFGGRRRRTIRKPRDCLSPISAPETGSSVRLCMRRRRRLRARKSRMHPAVWGVTRPRLPVDSPGDLCRSRRCRQLEPIAAAADTQIMSRSALHSCHGLPRAARRASLLALIMPALLALAGPASADAAPIRECGDATANYPRAGAYNITSRVAGCSVARNVAVRWYFRGERSPRGYRCRVRRLSGSWDVRCTASAGRVVRFQYFIAP